MVWPISVKVHRTPCVNSLFSFQREAVDWLKERRFALLALDMGLGKTAVSITAADEAQVTRICVVCPAAARINWFREFELFSKHDRPFTTVWTRTPEAHEVFSPWHSVISSYDLVQYIPEDQHFDLLILDESHFLKSIDAKRTRAVFGKNGLVRRSKKVWCLSGTPAPNHPAELWPMLFTFNLTTLSYDEFVERFCTSYSVGNFQKRITGAKTNQIPELRKILGKIMYRKTKEDVNHQLPPITFQHFFVEPGPVDYEIEYIQYIWPDDNRARLFAEIEKEKALLETMLKATKAYHHPDLPLKAMEGIFKSVATYRRFTGLQKVEPVAQLVREELENNAYDKIVIFAIHQGVIEGLRTKLSKFGVVSLYGNTPPKKRQKNIDRFQKDKRTRVFVGNIHAAGTAITLTAASQVLFVEQDWVPGNNAQAAMRCHRIGQKRPVFVRFVALSNSIDEKVMSIVKQKTMQLSQIFDGKIPGGYPGSSSTASSKEDFSVIDDTDASSQSDSDISHLF